MLRFVQYFLISGLDVNFGLEADEVPPSLDFLQAESSPLDKSYKPRILRFVYISGVPRILAGGGGAEVRYLGKKKFSKFS